MVCEPTSLRIPFASSAIHPLLAVFQSVAVPSFACSLTRTETRTPSSEPESSISRIGSRPQAPQEPSRRAAVGAPVAPPYNVRRWHTFSRPTFLALVQELLPSHPRAFSVYILILAPVRQLISYAQLRRHSSPVCQSRHAQDLSDAKTDELLISTLI